MFENEQLTAEQKIRQSLSGNPFQDPDFQHEGPDVIRHLWGGDLPALDVTFQQHSEQTVVRCANCKQPLGSFPTNDTEEQVRFLIVIRKEHAQFS